MALVYDPRTGTMVDDGKGVPGNPARAAAMQAQYNQPVTGPRTVVPLVQPPVLAGMGTVDRGPARSLPAPTGNNPALAAAMQAQYNQPVTGPRGLVSGVAAPLAYPEVPEFSSPGIAAPAPAAPAAVSARNPNAINVGGAFGQAYLGSMAAVPATALDALRRGATSLVGGDVNSLPGGPTALSDRAFGAMDQGLGQLGQANASLWDNLQSAGRNALGVQAAPAAGLAPPRVIAPTVAPTPAPAAVAPAPYNAYEDPNHPINRAPSQGLSASASMRGNYNAQNTDLGSLTERAAPTNGINFGFGVGGAETAQQYLARMQTVDQQRAAQRQQTGLMNEARWARHTLANNPTVGEMAGARAQLAALNPQINTLMQNQGGLAQMGLRNQGDLATAGLQNEGLLQRADMDAQARLGAADIAGQYGLREAQMTSEANTLKLRLESMTPAARKSSAEAALLETRLNAILAQLNTPGSGYSLGDVVADAKSGQQPMPEIPADTISGTPLTPEIVRLQQEELLRQALARQQKQR
uniref:Uncharacterized protein n=1 Tax=viral metagenome TaxID=1070528 RepID=A0A6M3X419_9ZZZZ